MKNQLFIRADANAKAAMGHLMRCLSIADACRQQDFQIEFIMAEETCRELVQQRGYAVWVLPQKQAAPEGEQALVLPMEEELEPLTEHLLKTMGKAGAALLVDSYQVTETYLKALSSLLPVIYMDDMGDRAWPVQAVVNYNHYAIHLPYTELYRKSTTKLFLGSAYTPLRAMFEEAGRRYEVRPRVKNILLSTGGSDPFQIADQLVHRLVLDEEFPADVTLHVLCGPFSQSYESLRSYAEIVGEQRLQLHANVTDMAALISSCDLAVSAAGSTIYELCAVGVPSVSFYFAENQRLGAQELDRIGAIPCMGNCSLGTETVLDAVAEQLKLYCRELRLRQSASTYMRGIVDGRGAQRLAEEFGRLLSLSRNEQKEDENETENQL